MKRNIHLQRLNTTMILNLIVLTFMSFCECAVIPAALNRDVGVIDEKGIVSGEFVPKEKRFATTPEPLEVTLDVYSGVSNPIWIVNQNDDLYSALLYELQQHVSMDLPSVLGYRGFETHAGEFNRTVATDSNPELEALLLYSGLNSGDAATIEIVKELLCMEAGEESYCQKISGTAMPIATSPSFDSSSTTNPMSWSTNSFSETTLQTLQTATLDTALSTTSSSSQLSTNFHSSTQTQSNSPTSTYTSFMPTVSDSSTSTTQTDTSSTSYSPAVSTSTSSSTTFPSTATETSSFPASTESTYTNPIHSISISPSLQTTSTSPSWPTFPSTTTSLTSTQSSFPSSTESTYTNPTHSTSTSPSSQTTFTSPSSSSTPSTTPKQCNGPKYEPNKWNNDKNVKEKNNCYNYATNSATGTFAKPGRGSGQVYNALTEAEVQDAAKRDGLKVLPDPGAGNFPKTNDCLVALVIWPGKDFHWYRQDANGNWSHKPGHTAATNRDNSGNVITDPRTADLGRYTFVTFMSYCPGGVTVNK